ncbi:MAG: Gldg family protein, partial [Pseudomonadales bacterium]|nr:Gldg family protein [Pseudomonadales bacterium]
ATTALADDIEWLVLVHPAGLSEQTLFAIDQFVMGGGRLMAFVDPLAEMARPPQPAGGMPMAPQGQASDLDRLMKSWGVTLRDNVVLTDSRAALTVRSADGSPVRHLGILGMEQDNLSRDDIVTAALENINLSTAGIFDVEEDAAVDVSPLIQSSEYSMPMESFRFQFMSDPSVLQQGFEPTGERYLVAARLSGSVTSAFPEGIDGFEGEILAGTDNLNAIVVADTDMLSDRLWVRTQSFFGQQISTPWANNGDLAINAIENLVGSSALISIRSRGQFTRPFDRVQELRREAEARYLDSANDLQAQLAETERKLNELQETRTEQNLLSLSPEQEAALEKFQEEKLRIRKQLREVRHQLDEDIEELGTMLKFLNIVLLPLVLTLGLLFLNVVRLKNKRIYTGGS